LRFTQEEFDTMVEQLLGGRLDSYDMLCTIADRVLRPSVIRWCNTDDTLRGRGLEEDIMQEIHTKLLLNVVTRFLRRNGPEGELNRDPEGFQAWMFTVARNVKRDFANKLRAQDIKTRELEGAEAETLSSEDLAGQQTHVDRLRQSFDVVLSADAGVHKVLTWLAQSLYILELDVTKIQSTQIVLEVSKGPKVEAPVTVTVSIPLPTDREEGYFVSLRQGNVEVLDLLEVSDLTLTEVSVQLEGIGTQYYDIYIISVSGEEYFDTVKVDFTANG
jgi:hypothetical protein